MTPSRTWPLVLLATGLLTCSTVQLRAATPEVDGPPLPISHSPVEFFRKLIAAAPEEIDQMLAGRSAEQQRVIRAKINEYRLYPPQIREWRLKATELRWYLKPLMQRPPEGRGQLLQTVPEEDRPLVEARLRQWDQLSAAEQQELLNNELALQYVSRPNEAPTPTAEQLKILPAAARAELDHAIDQWRSMSDQKRQELANRFSNYFKLTKVEQSRTLGLFTASEREQLTKQIGPFAGLNPTERERCLLAVRRFSRMSKNERLAFLQAAERWRSMSEKQRDAWRDLVIKLPPTPPGAGLPPLPPGFKPGQPRASASQLPGGNALAMDGN
ncbi:DUF3106 domain-containing protein [bacterium]|nr:DUF3106 domain-containing protein [bacterium]